MKTLADNNRSPQIRPVGGAMSIFCNRLVVSTLIAPLGVWGERLSHAVKSPVRGLGLAAVILLSSFTFTGYNIGDKAIDFKLKNVDGKMVSMADYKDAKGFIVIFTCNHCPFAKAYESRIMDLNTKYASKGYPVIAINPNDPSKVEADSYTNMQARAKEKNYQFPYLMDETQDIAKAYGAAHTPHVFILQKSGSDLVVKYIGAIDDNSDDASAVKEKYVENAVDNLLAGKAVNPASTKAIGCGIKWKS